MDIERHKEWVASLSPEEKKKFDRQVEEAMMQLCERAADHVLSLTAKEIENNA